MNNTHSQDTQSEVFDGDEHEEEEEGDEDYDPESYQPPVDFEAARKTQSGVARHNPGGTGAGGTRTDPVQLEGGRSGG